MNGQFSIVMLVYHRVTGATLMASSATIVFPAPVSAKTIRFSSAARAAACGATRVVDQGLQVYL